MSIAVSGYPHFIVTELHMSLNLPESFVVVEKIILKISLGCDGRVLQIILLMVIVDISLNYMPMIRGGNSVSHIASLLFAFVWQREVCKGLGVGVSAEENIIRGVYIFTEAVIG